MVKNQIFRLFGYIICFICLERFCHIQTEGFRLHKIASELPFNSSWETPPPTDVEKQRLKEMLSQPFYFLGSGGQCYAFASEDGNWVVKFFKHHHMRPKTWFNRIPLPSSFEPMRKQIIRCKKKRLHTIFNSCKIAYDHLKENSALIYIHLNKSAFFNQKLTLIDKIGIAHQIDLDNTEFALQKRATLIYPHLHQLMKNGDCDGAKKCIDSLLHLIRHRCKLGIADRDPIMKRNFGFIGYRAVEIDLGSYYLDELLKRSHSLKRQFFFETLTLKKWLKKRYPSLLPFFHETVSTILAMDE